LLFAKCPPFEITAVAAVVKIGTSPIEFKNASGDSIKNVTIMSDKYEAASVAIEAIFKPRNGIDVEMVGGLVENKQVAGSDEFTSECDSFCLSTRETTGIGVGE
jgi:hypothetical protein